MVPTHLSVLCLDGGRHALFLQAVHIHANSSPDALPWKEFPSTQLTNAQGDVVWGKGHRGEKLNVVYEECF